MTNDVPKVEVYYTTELSHEELHLFHMIEERHHVHLAHRSIVATGENGEYDRTSFHRLVVHTGCPELVHAVAAASCFTRVACSSVSRPCRCQPTLNILMYQDLFGGGAKGHTRPFAI